MWYPIMKPEPPGKHLSQIQSQLCHWVEPNVEKKTPPHHAGKAEGLGDSAGPSELYIQPYCRNGWRKEGWVA